MVLTIISLCIFLLYIGISLGVFRKIPASLSDTYYMYKDIKDWLKYLFPVMMFSISGLLLPSWLNATEGSNLQFLSFLTCASIMFVGAAPNFKGVSIENKVHTISAIVAAICAMLWCIFVVGSWGIILGYLLLILTLSLVTRTIKSSYTFWLEMITFLSLYTSLIIYNIIL